MSLSINHTLVNIVLQGTLSLAFCNAALALAPSAIYPSSSSTAPLTLMQKGQKFMELGQYAQAEECFRQSAVEHPRDASVHYYLANALVYEKKHPLAMEEYNLAYRLDPYGPVSGYCRKALMTYRMHGAPPLSEAESNEPISAAERLGIRLPTESEHGSVVRLIRSQTEREKSRHRQYAESIAATMVRGGETRAHIIERNAQDAINEAINSPLRMRPFENPFAAIEARRLQIEQMRKEAEEAAKQERAAASEKSDAYKRWSLEHEFSLDDIASNLEAQLLTKNLPGSARLRPEGTGLFVRYYGRSSADVDVHNSVAHFSNHRVFEKSDEDEVRDEQDSGKLMRSGNERPIQSRESTVRGAIIK
jgi:tetratricopeptide (TPR) repeat protein